MEIRDHSTADSFLEAASALLAADEARHNLAFGICHTLRTSPDAYPVFHLWTVEDGGTTVAAALMTPPFNLLVNCPRAAGALELLAEELARRGLELAGVTGALPEVDEFAQAWERLTGVPHRRRGAGHGIYGASRIRFPNGVAGEMRGATEAERDLLVAWLDAFAAEALPEAPHLDAEALVERRLDGRGGGFALWVDEEPVSVAGFGGETPTGVRIGPVYTPPELRGRGYGSAVTAALSARLLAEGRSHCFLYTDLGNPTSNRIYQKIGYELVCESAEYAFEG